MKNKNLKKIGIMGLTSLMSLSPMLNVAVEVKAETLNINANYGNKRLPQNTKINVDTSDFRNFNLDDVFNYTYTQLDAFGKSIYNQISFFEGFRGYKEEINRSQNYTQNEKDELLKDINDFEFKLGNFRAELGNFARRFGGTGNMGSQNEPDLISRFIKAYNELFGAQQILTSLATKVDGELGEAIKENTNLKAEAVIIEPPVSTEHQTPTMRPIPKIDQTQTLPNPIPVLKYTQQIPTPTRDRIPTQVLPTQNTPRINVVNPTISKSHTVDNIVTPEQHKGMVKQGEVPTLKFEQLTPTPTRDRIPTQVLPTQNTPRINVVNPTISKSHTVDNIVAPEQHKGMVKQGEVPTLKFEQLTPTPTRDRIPTQVLPNQTTPRANVVAPEQHKGMVREDKTQTNNIKITNTQKNTNQNSKQHNKQKTQPNKTNLLKISNGISKNTKTQVKTNFTPYTNIPTYTDKTDLKPSRGSINTNNNLLSLFGLGLILVGLITKFKKQS